jgi:hypothetical protein
MYSGQDRPPTFFFQNYEEIASYHSSIIFCLIIRQYYIYHHKMTLPICTEQSFLKSPSSICMFMVEDKYLTTQDFS